MIRIVKWWFFLIVAFYFCALLTVLPLPQDYQWYRPLFLLMLVIFCQIKQPTLFNPLVAWLMGLCLDSLLGNRLGEYALIFAIIAYVAADLRPRFVQGPLWLQNGKVFLLISLAQIFIFWFHAFAGQTPNTLYYWMGTVASCLMWPIFVAFFQGLSRLFCVAPYSSPRSSLS